MSLKILEEKLPPDHFMRIRRSFIINLHHIRAIERSQVLIANQRITITDLYVNTLDQYFDPKYPCMKFRFAPIAEQEVNQIKKAFNL